MAHICLLAVVEGLEESALRRHGPTHFGFAASGCDLLLTEAMHERADAVRPRPARTITHAALA